MEEQQFSVVLKDEQHLEDYKIVKDFVTSNSRKYGKNTIIKTALRIASNTIKRHKEEARQLKDSIP